MQVLVLSLGRDSCLISKLTRHSFTTIDNETSGVQTVAFSLSKSTAAVVHDSALHF